MITLQFTTPSRLSPALWFVCPTIIYRYLPSVFVDAFFADGSLRLSSFEQFHKHKDEQRLDQREGETFFVHVTEERGGQTITARAHHGYNTFVLCASTRDDLMSTFGCDSYIRIDDPTAFGQAVARRIPGLTAGSEGFCVYQDKKIIQRNLGFLNVEGLKATPGEPAKDGAVVEFNPKGHRLIRDAMGHLPLFLKDKSFAQQAEYRIIWAVSRPVPPFIDVKVPEAIRFCSKPTAVPWLTLNTEPKV